MKTRNPLFAAALLASCALAQAQPVNGGFESGLNGWTTFGDASTQAGAPAGAAQLVLTTAGLDPDEFNANNQLIGPFNLSGSAAVLTGVAGGLEALGGYALGSFDPPNEFAIEGSLAQQSFSAAAGSTLSFFWNFGTRGLLVDSDFYDYGFVVIDGTVTRLAGVPDATLAGSGNDLFQTGVRSFSYTFASGGVHTVAFGVVDIGDSAIRSTLAIDAVQVTAIPEPQTWALMLAGLGLVAAGAMRRRAR